MVRACERAGATVKEGWPANFSFPDLLDTYTFMLGAFDFSMTPPMAKEFAKAQLASRPEPFRRGALSTFADWQTQNMKRLGYRAREL